MTKYTPPDSHNIVFNFEGDAYSPPDSYNVVFNFGVEQDKRQYVSIIGIEPPATGKPDVKSAIVTVYPVGFDSFAYGGQNVRNKARFIYAQGFSTPTFGTAKAYNLKQFINLNGRGFAASAFGTAAFLGGVKYIKPNGVDTLRFGSLTIKDPKESRTLRPIAFNAMAFGSAAVSPQILYAKPFVATAFGTATVQRNPSPVGFVATRYGLAWISHSPRYYQPLGFDATGFGYPRIFDPTQRIYQQLAPIDAGIFGEIKIANKNKIIKPEGFDSSEFSRWSVVESNRRSISAQGQSYLTLGLPVVRNKTPSFAPDSINSEIFGQPSIGYRIRRISVTGIPYPVPSLGIPQVSKTLELNPRGFMSSAFGDSTVSNLIRTLALLGKAHTSFGLTTVWFRKRPLKVDDGIFSFVAGKPAVDHSIRNIDTNGKAFDIYGTPWVSYRVRTIEPVSINQVFPSVHRVGGTQHLAIHGFVATAFGTRIIPEIQTIYPKGFAEIFGINEAKLHRRYIKPLSISSDGIPNVGRWGKPAIYNHRQYIRMYFDPDSQLNPPSMEPKWLKIENRNKSVVTVGNVMSVFGRMTIDNKARPLYPSSFQHSEIGKPMISYKVRKVLPYAIEEPYISGWTNLSNSAKVIAPKGISMQAFGSPLIVNTRRTFPLKGFESSIIGYPMVVFRIRELTFENRYGIAPPYITPPTVQHHTRYIEPSGFDRSAMGWVELTRYQARIVTRWSHKDHMGEPTIRNLTPEVKARGAAQDEFGLPNLRLSKAFYKLDGFIATIIPKPLIEFKNRKIKVLSIQSMQIGSKLIVTKTGSPPYTSQYIYLGNPLFLPDGTPAAGYGIGIPGSVYWGMPEWDDPQVPKPSLNQNVIRVINEYIETKMGMPSVSANSIRVEPGIQELVVGNPTVSLKHRQIIVAPYIFDEDNQVSEPLVTPFRIEPQSLTKGVVFGKPVVRNAKGEIKPSSNDFMHIPSPQIELRKRYIQPIGIFALRFGWHKLPEWKMYVEQYESNDMSSFGSPSVVRDDHGKPQAIAPKGFGEVFGTTKIELKNRQIYPFGFTDAAMGYSSSSDYQYYPQSLHIGFKKPIMIVGKDCAVFGSTWVSYKVREIVPKGFDSFISTYGPTEFKKRMKVIRQPQTKAKQFISVVGMEHTSYGTPNIRNKVHYIRPDGNSDQYRKGAF
ncbi:hypothetical protein F994_02772 [Acinetobacter bohemicus ANC 3994]|uniref:Uncharacterized protein n=1 Tax=Acinetobacter bohemicus ANC 3994 TaxID=1217715 RepID=N8NWU3_9GAMM|nr:hypothetical protein [Acinetobacter bohemicus]ENU18645.1 hypothetical protein F994_02772 [Acinetobacter bohemicus ANC 3994]